MSRKQCSVFLLLLAALWVVPASTGLAAEPAGGAKVDVDRNGVHVDVDATNDQSNVAAVKARDLVGVRVYNPANENLGKIEDLVANPAAGKVRYAVLSFGGFLGMGDKLFAVPWHDLKLVSKGTTSSGTTKEDYYVLNVDKDSLKNAPGFDKANWPDFGNASWSTDIDKFYKGRHASEAGGEARVDVDRDGVRVDVGRKNDQANVSAVKVSDLTGMRVYNPSNEDLGKIEDLVINPSSGKFRYSVLSFGGFLGMGDKLFAVPWKDLKLMSKGTTGSGTVKEDHYVLDVNKDALKNAPGFDKSNWPDFANGNWSADVDKFYTSQRAPATRR
jgi:sporulation protein YlmC with PRC-barrel domain